MENQQNQNQSPPQTTPPSPNAPAPATPQPQEQPTPPPPPTQPAAQQGIPTPPPKPKFKKLPFFVGTVLLVLLLLGAGLIWYAQSISPITNPKQKTEATPTQVPTVTPKQTVVPLSSIFKEFTNASVSATSVTDAQNKTIETTVYTNEEFGIRFFYPKTYYLKAGFEPARDQDRPAQILAALTDKPDVSHTVGGPTKREMIDDDITCRIDPNPGGLCRETLVSWLDISIVQNPDETEYQTSATVETIGNMKAISTTTANLDGTTYPAYSVLLNKNNTPYEVTFSSTTIISDSEEFKLAIWLLLESLTAL
jgi:hypothetical protein